MNCDQKIVSVPTIEPERLRAVVGGGEWTNWAVNKVGPWLSPIFGDGDEWKNTPCLAQANQGGEAARDGTMLGIAGAGYAGGRYFGKSKLAGLAAAGAMGVVANVVEGIARQKVQNSYIKANCR